MPKTNRMHVDVYTGCVEFVCVCVVSFFGALFVEREQTNYFNNRRTNKAHFVAKNRDTHWLQPDAIALRRSLRTWTGSTKQVDLPYLVA